MNTIVETSSNWSLTKKILFRFFTAYFLLYLFSQQSILGKAWDLLATWSGRLLIDKNYEIKVWPNGSGDTTFNYLLVFGIAVVALFICITWSAFDRKRKNYDKLLYWLMVMLRFSLALVMTSYGMVKILKTQFPFSYLFTLDQSVGDLSPMGLAWTYMGYSTGYNLFTGLAEFLCGFFLLFHRTALFGALLSMVVMLNVVAMNFFYDIPVKLFSMHLFFIALFIALPDMKRLLLFLFLNKPVPAANRWQPRFLQKWKRITYISLKYLLIALLLYNQIMNAVLLKRRYMPDKKYTPLHGIYEIKQISSGKSGLADSITAFKYWKKIYIEHNDMMFAKKTDNELVAYTVKIDTAKHIFSFWDKKKDSIYLHYNIPEKSRLSLDGCIGKDSIHVQLTGKDPNDFLLINRGFHWINEYPFNR